MTAEELIEELKKYPPHLDIVVCVEMKSRDYITTIKNINSNTVLFQNENGKEFGCGKLLCINVDFQVHF